MVSTSVLLKLTNCLWIWCERNHWTWDRFYWVRELLCSVYSLMFDKDNLLRMRHNMNNVNKGVPGHRKRRWQWSSAENGPGGKGKGRAEDVYVCDL